MKTTKQLKQKIRAIIFAFSALIFTTNFSCDKVCEALALADLTIPLVADLLDQYGHPLIDPNTGQIINAANEIYFNQRTGEYFNSDFPPTQGLLVGDIIEMGTNIFNSFSDTDCEFIATASPSITAPELQVSGPYFNGVLPLQGMPTGSINENEREFTATLFELITPGNYSVDFNANAPRNIPEHSYDNNFYYGGNGNYGRSSKSFSFTVTENPEKETNRNIENYSNKPIAPKTLNDVKKLNIYKFATSKNYASWYLQKIKNTIK